MLQTVSYRDNADEARRSYASTAFTEELPGWDEWYAQAHQPLTIEEEEAAYLEYLADCARCEAAAAPSTFTCATGIKSAETIGERHQQMVIWVCSPRTGHTIEIPAARWHDLPAGVVNRILAAFAAGMETASFTTEELRTIAATAFRIMAETTRRPIRIAQ